jgi:flagellar motor switch protein FliN/FliY
VPDNDDLLDPSEIEALLKSAGSLGGPKPSAPPPPPAVPAAQPSSDILNPTEIEALLRQRDGSSPAAPGTGAGPEELLDRAQQGLAAAMGGGAAPKFASPGPPKPKPPPDPRLTTAKPFAFQPLDDITADAHPKSLEALEEVELDLRIELGRAELLIEEVLKLREGSVVPLDKLAGDPVDILVNGRLVARGEVLVLNDNFCVRVAEILAPQMP